ncbi:MAG: phosphoadenosine phosphosulfate reductase [Betaproteobacteria bacterium RBG_16_56_24]|nr:MAG: phosphoadenosine phosphosulfate reductase [Betaproteobacteria bacterium RBG_16_56_24]
MIRHVISVSGGKDSAATLLIALESCPAESIVPIFCDTGNEHQAVYDYLSYLEQALDITITRLKADFTENIARKRMFIARDQRKGRKDGKRLRWSNKAKRRALEALHPTGNPFLDLCMWKGRFPSRKAQFCTEELKRNMAVAFQLDLIDAGHQVLSWQGVRRDESLNRRNAKKIERIGGGIWTFRPIVEWTAIQVFEFCAKRGIQPNPLYKMGMSRVGCMPCINVNKAELRQIATRFPDHVAKISEWEWLVSQCTKRGFSTMCGDKHDAKDRRIIFADLNIHARIDWANTARGGRQRDMLFALDESVACSSSYGLCE